MPSLEPPLPKVHATVAIVMALAALGLAVAGVLFTF